LKAITLALLLCLPTIAGAADKIAWELLGKLPHSRSDFVQGLEIRHGKLFQGTGIWGQSKVQVFDLKSGRLLREQALPNRYFGEGITVFGDKVVQLTWRTRRGLVFNRDDLRPLEEFSLPGQGWGLTNDGDRLIYSDGSHLLRYILPGSWTMDGTLAVTREGKPLPYLNELEWTPMGIFANVWRKDIIVRINPDNGSVTGELDLTGLLPGQERRPGTDVLNGIAYDASDNTFWVTGKNWPWLYQIRLIGADWELVGKKQ
jgi:glutamine cyclotransferase